MYKFVVVVPLFFAAVSAGLIGAPIATHGVALAAPAVAVHAAPIAVAHAAPAATSYANLHRIVHDSVPVVKTVSHTAPVAVHAAPVVVATVGHGHGLH